MTGLQLNELQKKTLANLHSTYPVLFDLDISLYHGYVILIGLMASAFITMVIIVAGLVEVYRPLQRLKAFVR